MDARDVGQVRRDVALGELDHAVLHVLGVDEQDVVEDAQLLEQGGAYQPVEVGAGHQPVALGHLGRHMPGWSAPVPIPEHGSASGGPAAPAGSQRAPRQACAAASMLSGMSDRDGIRRREALTTLGGLAHRRPAGGAAAALAGGAAPAARRGHVRATPR